MPPAGGGEIGGGEPGPGEEQGMTAIFRHEGDAIDYTPGADVAAGDVVVQGELVGIARLDIKANTLGALAVTGVFDFPKATGGGTAITAGAQLYWDDTNDLATTSDGAGANKAIGKATQAAADADATVRARMSQ
jgi:predicted RecA/RadA family phage recombinase